MYEAILVLKYGLYRKEAAGCVQTDNVNEQYVKVISGASPEECRRKADDFLDEAQFIALKGKGANSANR